MKTIDRIGCTLVAYTLVAAAAFAQGAPPQAPPQAPPAPAGEPREASRAEADAAKKAMTAQQAASERAQKHVEQAQKQVQREVVKVQEALKEAQRELELYAKGTAALDTARYEKALEAFAEAAALKGEKGDSALYWKAFSEYKVQALQAALESLKEMQKSFPDSRWLDQALALEFEVKGAMGKPVPPSATPDEELKLIAIESLLHTDAEQALPMLEKMIAGQQSVRLKKRALFVVSQSKSPKARGILTSVARGSSDADLQLEALRYLGLLGGAEDKKLLAEIYGTSKDRDVKMRVVDALFVAGDAAALVDMARKETDQELRKRIVERLSRMKAKEATDYMLELINK